MLFSKLKEEFPTLINNSSLLYFDSAASTQTHQSVLDRMNKYYEEERCNVNRGDFDISRKVSDDLEEARTSVGKLFNVDPNKIMFTTGATQGLNMVAEWYKDKQVVLISEAEHTANILPWIQQGRTTKNKRLQVIPIKDNGMLDMNVAEKLINQYGPTGFLSIHTTSNVTGIPTPHEKLIKLAHNNGMATCLDACQTPGTKKLKLFTTDFAVLSGHKLYGPTGIGILYSRLGFDKLRALTFGGDTANAYDFDGNITWHEGPSRHEPGTPNIAGILGMGTACEWLDWITYDKIEQKMMEIDLALSEAGLFDIEGMDLIYKNYRQNGRNVYTFNTSIHPSDISAMLSLENVAVRAGKLCAHPIVNKVSGGKGVLRISPGVYNTDEDIELLVKGLWKVMKRLA